MSLARAREAVQVSKMHDEIDAINHESLKRHNLAVVRSGTLAVESGLTTHENIVEQTWGTVQRHLYLMQMLGFNPQSLDSKTALKGGEYDGYKWFVAQSQPVKIDTDIYAILRQHPGKGLSGHEQTEGYSDSLEERGIEATLDDFASPRSTLIDIYDRSTPKRPGYVGSIALSPNSARWHDETFKEEWGSRGAMFPFRGVDFVEPAHRELERRSIENHFTVDYPMDDKQLVFAAGLNATFNRELDTIEWALDNYPLE